MPSIQARMVCGLFKLIGVNKMLDKHTGKYYRMLAFFARKYGFLEVLPICCDIDYITSSGAAIEGTMNFAKFF